jgi:hypothetical protein
MQKIYFEEQVNKRISILKPSGDLTPKTRLKDGVLNVDEIRYYINDYVLYINIPKLLLRITNSDKTQIDRKKIIDFIKTIFGSEKALNIKDTFASISLAGNYNIVLKNIQKIIKEKNTSNDNTEQTNQNAQSPEQAAQQTDSTNKNNQQQEPQASAPTPQTNETKESVGKTILDNFKTKITDQKMMEKVNTIDFNNIKDNDLNSLYIKYLTFLYLNNTKELEVIKKMIKDKKGKSSKGLPPKAFISKYGQLIFSGLPNIETIEEIKKNINVYFENEDDYDFYKELKHTDLFLERYLKG